MKLFNYNINRLLPIAAVLSAALAAPVQAADDLPPGFHRMTDGTIMANNPATAIAPPGYYLRSNGILIKLDDDLTAKPKPMAAQATPTAAAQVSNVPQGFHRMPDGRVMANNPAAAVAPPGYHLMPDGVLMPNAGGGHNAHIHHAGGGSHGQGMWMFEYRYTRMNMKDLLDTTDTITADDVTGPDYGYMMSPETMSMDMHMLMAMYGISENFTLMAMAHFMANNMDMVASDGTESSMSNAGFGDTVISLMYQTPFKVVAGIGFGIPTGGFIAEGDMKMSSTMDMNDVVLPYGMQLGSGSFDLRPSFEISDRIGAFTLGSRFEYIWRLNENNAGYTLGNRGELTGWGEWHAMKYFSVLSRLSFSDQEKISGKNDEIPLTMNHGGSDMLGSPAADPTLYGGMRLDGTIGMRVNTADKMWGGRLELGMPLYQSLWGPQMKTTWILTFALEAMF